MYWSHENVFIEYLSRHKLSVTLQRKLIAEVFLETLGHFSAEQFCRIVQERAPDIGKATVYRTLKLLVESGLADSFDVGDGVLIYEHAYGVEHHDHLICIKCGRKVEIVDAVIEKRQEDVARENGYDLLRHRMFLYGLCPECQSAS